jgi:hypothetical protein
MPSMQFVDEGRLQAALAGAPEVFRSADPFPHMVIDGFLKPEVAERLEAEFPPVEHRIWKHHLHRHSHKFACNRIEALPPSFQAIFEELNAKPLLSWLEQLTGIAGLLPDDELEGGGLHQIIPGGFLRIHADFNFHPTTGHHRRLNLLVYLNREFRDEWNGNLELWASNMSHCVRSIAPVLNRAVLFATTDAAYHGHPRPLTCPPGQTRKSLALYYYTATRPADELRRPHSTLYKTTPQESMTLHQLRLLRRYVLSRTSVQMLRGAVRRLLGRP